MRRHLPRAAVLLTLAVALLGCGDDGKDADEDDSRDRAPASTASACGELTDADVERLTGAAVTHEEKDLLGGRTCTFNDAGGQSAVMVLLAPTEVDIDALVAAGRVGDADDVTTEEVEVPGTEAAVVVTDSSYDLVTASLVATTGEVGYTVYGSGPTAAEEARVAIAALTVLLGGTYDGPVAAAAGAPCEVLTAEDVGQVLGVPVTAEPGELGGSGEGRCSYDGSDTSVSVYELDRTAPLESVVASYEKSGSTVEELDVSGLLAAYLVEKPTGTGSVDAYLAAQGGTYVLSVRGADGQGSAELARRLVPFFAS